MATTTVLEPGREGFGGRLLHSAQYRNPDGLRGRDVLVIGAGSSGMEIAYDLVQGGAGRIRVAARTPPSLLLRSPAGPPIAKALYTCRSAWPTGDPCGAPARDRRPVGIRATRPRGGHVPPSAAPRRRADAAAR